MDKANTPTTQGVDLTEPSTSWFTRPLSAWACLLGWIVASGVFVGAVAGAGGPAVGDAYLIIYPTWAVSHGQFVCMYPPHPASILSLAAPVYPMVAGGVGYITHIGSSVSFPTGTALGHNCGKAVVAMVNWSAHAGAVEPTLRTGYVVWLFLMAGLIMVLRASGRGRSGWEPTGLIIAAALPPVWFCVEMYAHPQDVVAMGFTLAAVACSLRSRWIAAGIFIAIALLTQQYTLLVAIPLFVVAPAAGKIRFVGAAAATVAIVALPLIVLTSGSAIRPAFLGTGNVGGLGGTVAWEAHIRGGAALFLGSRLPPLVLALALSWYVVRRVGPTVLDPQILIPLIAVCLSLRLVFEDTIFSYYYMPLAVSLVVIDVVHGRIRQRLVAWVAMVTLVYTEPSILVWRQILGTGRSSLASGRRRRYRPGAHHSRRSAAQHWLECCGMGRGDRDSGPHLARVEQSGPSPGGDVAVAGALRRDWYRVGSRTARDLDTCELPHAAFSSEPDCAP